MGIPRGNGSFVVLDEKENKGTGVVSSTAFTGTWPQDQPFTLEFFVDDEDIDGELQYRIPDPNDDNGDSPLLEGTFASGQPIVYEDEGFSLQLTVEGRPEEGDEFQLQPESQDLFSTYSQLADALEAGVSNPADQARLNNAVNRSLEDLDNALGNLLDVRASLGTRLQAVETQRRINDDQILQLRSTLSEIEDLDYAEAISRFNLQQTALQAAQQTYVQVQRLSLFNFL